MNLNLYLCALASAATHVAEFAAPAAPVLLVLLHGTLLGREAEAVEGLAADLTKNHLVEVERKRGSVQSHRSQCQKKEKEKKNLISHHLVPSFAGAEQADGLRRGGDRSENAEAAHQPDVLHGTVLLTHTHNA